MPPYRTIEDTCAHERCVTVRWQTCPDCETYGYYGIPLHEEITWIEQSMFKVEGYQRAKGLYWSHAPSVAFREQLTRIQAKIMALGEDQF